MEKKIAVLPGDGIGPEIIKGAIDVLQVIEAKFGHSFEYNYANIGGSAFDKEGTPLSDKTIALCKSSDAIMLGAVGGPKWDTLPVSSRPEQGLLRIRKELNLFANLRPTKYFPSLAPASPLRQEVIENVDLMMVRELTGGIYFGTPSERTTIGGKAGAVDTLLYTKEEINIVLKKAFEIAKTRSKKVTSVDKANVLESSRLWRECATEMAVQYPEVKLEHMLVDNAAMQLISNPRQFDVVVTENMFGDILSDEASVLTGSLGMLASASISEDGPSLYEPIHGSAPDIAGQNIANPLATILSAAMMLRLSFEMEQEAQLIENAVDAVLNKGYRTKDILSADTTLLTTSQMVEQVKAEMMTVLETVEA
ncbi:3-isopropylmalate dehydrogenase [Niallia circulans]|uniref:3-isopropylmalate dehydrogenase n=1 Tax=Niallia circulans TaxID=1397 RepID=A0A553SK91_NIACI|nr:3-isopropylmalate dehydrogenase [Niallia circulans]TRZ37382.1 3-isopropylmalate dehydrogenase [Niallia circulans]